MEGSLELDAKAVEEPSAQCPDFIAMKTWLGSGPSGVLCSPPPWPPVHLLTAGHPAEKDFAGNGDSALPPSLGTWDNLRSK